MDSAGRDRIIAEQIDVIIIGERKHELIGLMLDKRMLYYRQSRNNPTYVLGLNSILGNKMASEAAGIVHGAIKHANIAIYTKQIVTDSFWVHIHFFLHDNRILDPILSEITRGGIKICLIACDESADTNEFRKYLGNTGRFNPSVDQKSWKNKTVRPEQVFEGKILSKMNDMSMYGFPSLLALKVTAYGRIIEESSNLRLTTNQIFRWIVDRHFRNRYSIRLKEQLGDEIENYYEKNDKTNCCLI